MVRVLLINPPFTNYGGIEGYGGKSIPINLLYLASYIKEKCGVESLIIDAEAEGMTYEDIEREIMNHKPKIIGITMPTPTVEQVLEICKRSKKIDKSIVTIVGGYHPTALPIETVKEEYVDIAVIGEGEETFLEVVKNVGRKKGFANIKGIAFKKGDKIIKTPQRELIRDLDSVPFPARYLVNIKKYYSSATKRLTDAPATYIFTSRGCPFDCIFCNAKSMWRRKTRFRSTNSVVDEIEDCVKKYGIREFNFGDELFTLNKKRVVDICEEILRRKLKIVWVCMSRVDTITPKMIKIMKRAGCRKITFGFESGDPQILKNIRKETDLNKAREAVEAVKKEGIEVFGNFMIGNLGETKSSVKRTINFAKSLNLDTVSFFITIPYPGTDLYTIALDKGLIDTKMPWSRFSPVINKKPVMRTEELSQEDLLSLQKKAFRSFYMRPKYIFRKIANIKSKSDIKIILEGIKLFFRVSK